MSARQADVTRHAAALVLWVGAAGASAEPLSRAQAVARALERNPAVQRSLADREGLRGRAREARADALPELNLLGSYQRYQDPGFFNSPNLDEFPPDEVLDPREQAVLESFVAHAVSAFVRCAGKFALKMPALAAAFFHELKRPQGHAAIDRFAHIVHGERGDADRGEGLHLDAGAGVHPDRRFADDAWVAQAGPRPESDVHLQRVGLLPSRQKRRRVPGPVGVGFEEGVPVLPVAVLPTELQVAAVFAEELLDGFPQLVGQGLRK